MPIKNAFLYRSTELISQKNRPCVSTRAVNFPHESKSPPTPLQKGGSVFGISSGRVSSFTVKKSGVFFSPPFWRGTGGICFSSHHQTPTKKPPLRFHERAVNFPHESKSPPTPLQKGGSVFGISSGRVSSFTVKKSGVFFSPPFLKGGGGDLLFITHPNAHKKTTPAFPRKGGF